MYCTHCGKELDENAKFCGRCGAKVERSETSKLQEATSRPEDPDGNLHIAESPSEPSGEAIDVQLLDETESSSRSKDNSSTLKAAVASNRKRSRRRMPLILVIALVLALTASIAFAAYYAYTQVYLPQQEAQQQANEQATQQAAYDSAMEAYQPVIDEYQRALNTVSESQWGTLQFNLYNDNYEYQFANTMGLDGFGVGDIYYGLVDLNNDGILELLVAQAINEGFSFQKTVVPDAACLYGIYTLVDGNSAIVDTNIWERNTLYYLGNNLFFNRSSGGATTGVSSYLTWSGRLQEENDPEDANSMPMDSIESVSWEPTDWDNLGNSISFRIQTTIGNQDPVVSVIPVDQSQYTYFDPKMADVWNETLQPYLSGNSPIEDIQWQTLTRN